MDLNPYSVMHPPVVFDNEPHPFQLNRHPTQIWDMEGVWKELGTKGKHIRVAILDSGFDATAPYHSRTIHTSSVVPSVCTLSSGML